METFFIEISVAFGESKKIVVEAGSTVGAAATSAGFNITEDHQVSIDGNPIDTSDEVVPNGVYLITKRMTNN